MNHRSFLVLSSGILAFYVTIGCKSTKDSESSNASGSATVRDIPGESPSPRSSELNDAAVNPRSASGMLKSIYVESFSSDKRLNQSSLVYTLESSDSTYLLHFKIDPPPVNQRINVFGSVVGKTITVDKWTLDDSTLASSRKAEGESARLLRDPVKPASGARKVLVVIAHLPGQKPVEPSISQLEETIEKVAAGYSINSNKMFSFQPVGVFGPFDIDTQVDKCNWFDWLAPIKAKAESLGIEHDEVVAVIPQVAECEFVGISSDPILVSFPADYIIAHELGHKLGLNHASSLQNEKFREYGDDSDFMGRGTSQNLNVPHRMMVGWESEAQIRELTKSDVFTILKDNQSPEAGASKLVYVKTKSGRVFHVTYTTSPNPAVHILQSTDRNGINYDAISTLLVGRVTYDESFETSEKDMKVELLAARDQNAVVRITVPGSPAVYLWQNPRNRFDVNGDGQVTPLDALLIINHLSRTKNNSLEKPRLSPGNYLDVSGEGQVTPLDALQVINQLSRQNRGAETAE